MLLESCCSTIKASTPKEQSAEPTLRFTRLSRRIEDYALIGNRHTAALVAIDGSIDWLCVPRFDSPACFAAMLGGEENGRWLISPRGQVKSVRRQYCGDTLILETIFETVDGEAALIDFMPIKEETGHVDLIRLVQGRRGSVAMRLELALRFDYGKIVPWVRQQGGCIKAIGGPDTVLLRTPVETLSNDFETTADFIVSKGQTIPFTFTRYNSYESEPPVSDPASLLTRNLDWWTRWASQCTYQGPYRKEVIRSLITLKALTYGPTGAIIAAPTTSLPERLGGHLNWDYRCCWLRDATFTSCALLESGYHEQAVEWREWLMRSVAGQADKLQPVYGLAGERRLQEFELPHLSGYEGSKPVRIGNAAYQQLQLDVYGELLSSLYIAHRYHIEVDHEVWFKHCELLSYLEEAWEKPDDGIWETRKGPRHITESKVAAWVAFDRGIKLIESLRLDGPLEKWRTVRDRIHADVCAHGYDSKRRSFVESYGRSELDAALLFLPLRGFLPVDDPRIVGTVEAIQRDLTQDGLIKRSLRAADGGEPGAFLPCNFWLVDCLVAMGRTAEARKIFERLLGLRNDVGLLSEEYDCGRRRQLGNYPQALSHMGLINSALNLSPTQTPLKLSRAD